MIKRNKATQKQVVKRTPPFLPEEISEATVGFKEQTEREETIGYQHFKREITEGIDRPYLTIKNCIFTQQLFISCRFKAAQLWDIRFENCDLSNVSFTESSLHRVEFIGCKLVGTNFSEATLHQVLIQECHGRYINLSMSKITQTQFIRSDFEGGALIHCRLNGIELNECRLVQAELFQTPLQGVDLRTSQIEGIQLNTGDLKGVIVNTMQAMELLPLLGIVIKEQ